MKHGSEETNTRGQRFSWVGSDVVHEVAPSSRNPRHGGGRRTPSSANTTQRSSSSRPASKSVRTTRQPHLRASATQRASGQPPRVLPRLSAHALAQSIKRGTLSTLDDLCKTGTTYTLSTTNATLEKNYARTLRLVPSQFSVQLTS